MVDGDVWPTEVSLEDSSTSLSGDAQTGAETTPADAPACNPHLSKNPTHRLNKRKIYCYCC